jgi:hypothetical protein
MPPSWNMKVDESVRNLLALHKRRMGERRAELQSVTYVVHVRVKQLGYKFHNRWLVRVVLSELQRQLESPSFPCGVIGSVINTKHERTNIMTLALAAAQSSCSPHHPAKEQEQAQLDKPKDDSIPLHYVIVTW